MFRPFSEAEVSSRASFIHLLAMEKLNRGERGTGEDIN